MTTKRTLAAYEFDLFTLTRIRALVSACERLGKPEGVGPEIDEHIAYLKMRRAKKRKAAARRDECAR